MWRHLSSMWLSLGSARSGQGQLPAQPWERVLVPPPLLSLRLNPLSIPSLGKVHRPGAAPDSSITSLSRVSLQDCSLKNCHESPQGPGPWCWKEAQRDWQQDRAELLLSFSSQLGDGGKSWCLTTWVLLTLRPRFCSRFSFAYKMTKWKFKMTKIKCKLLIDYIHFLKCRN